MNLLLKKIKRLNFLSNDLKKVKKLSLIVSTIELFE
jgi:hypothetical protein